MLKRLLVLAFLLSCIPAAAQAQHSISLWARQHQGHDGIAWMPWYTYDGAFSIDTRYNFDEPNSWVGLVGKNFTIYRDPELDISALNVSASAYVGGMLGDSKGYVAQLTITASYGRASVMVWEQYVWAARPTRDYFYTWIDGGMKIAWRITSGIGIQQFTEHGQPTYLDMGPYIKLDLVSKSSLKLWVTWDPQHPRNQKLFAGLNYAP